MRRSHARRFVPGVNDLQLRNALAYVSCTRSSASSREPTSRLATRYTWSASASASSSKCARSRASVAMRRASRASVSGPASLTGVPYRCPVQVPGTRCGRPLFPLVRDFGKAGPGERRDDLVLRRLPVVPFECDLAHEVRVRVFDALVTPQHAGESPDATLAAHAAHSECRARHQADSTGTTSFTRLRFARQRLTPCTGRPAASHA